MPTTYRRIFSRADRLGDCRYESVWIGMNRPAFSIVLGAVFGLGVLAVLIGCSTESNATRSSEQRSQGSARVDPTPAATQHRERLVAAKGAAAPRTLLTNFPYFELQTLAGTTWGLSDQGPRPKLLMFWATWCPHCKKIFPTIQELHETYGPDLVVAAISLHETGDVQAYVDHYQLTMDILLDGDRVGEMFDVPGTPAILLLDSDNTEVFGTIESNPADPGLRNAVEAVMARYAAQRS